MPILDAYSIAVRARAKRHRTVYVVSYNAPGPSHEPRHAEIASALTEVREHLVAQYLPTRSARMAYEQLARMCLSDPDFHQLIDDCYRNGQWGGVTIYAVDVQTGATRMLTPKLARILGGPRWSWSRMTVGVARLIRAPRVPRLRPMTR